MMRKRDRVSGRNTLRERDIREREERRRRRGRERERERERVNRTWSVVTVVVTNLG
jgi:hypothetical protein